MRRPALLTAVCLVLAMLVPAAQRDVPASRPGPADFLPEAGVAGGPFLFRRGTPRPAEMDAFSGRPLVKSPDGGLAVTVTGPKKSYGAWVTINPSTFPDGPVQVWPIQGSVDILWGPNSQRFALTDNRYANLSYVLVFGTAFRMGESGPGLGVPVTDLSGVVRRAFGERAQEYYGHHAYEVDNCYLEALRWVDNDHLLIGVSGMTSGPPTLPNRGQKEWDVAYLLDVPHNSVVREVGESQLLTDYGIKVADQ